MRFKEALIVFAKNIDSGDVKSRISNTHGIEVAREIYVNLLQACTSLCKQVEADIILYFSDHKEEVGIWKDVADHQVLQSPGNLGERMKNAIDETLKSYDKVILIGSDCPYISKHHIEVGFKALDTTDFVIGPTFDGGYYLIGMKKSEHFLFEGIEWSSVSVFSDTIDKIFKKRKSVASLEMLEDVDYYKDYEKWQLNKHLLLHQ